LFLNPEQLNNFYMIADVSSSSSSRIQLVTIEAYVLTFSQDTTRYLVNVVGSFSFFLSAAFRLLRLHSSLQAVTSSSFKLLSALVFVLKHSGRSNQETTQVAGIAFQEHVYNTKAGDVHRK